MRLEILEINCPICDEILSQFNIEDCSWDYLPENINVSGHFYCDKCNKSWSVVVDCSLIIEDFEIFPSEENEKVED